MNDDQSITSLVALRHMMAENGATRLYAKFLAANDNSKNQPYFGGDLSSINILPFGKPVLDQEHGNLKAPLDFSWLDDGGHPHRAPNAQLIVYPQYPEVRFSGYLKGCDPAHRPSALLGPHRIAGRALFLGICDDGRILGYVVGPDSAIARELSALAELERVGVFLRIPFGEISDEQTNRRTMLAAICRIARLGWIDSKRLRGDGVSIPYQAANGGGYTLEAELGIKPNGYSDPDFHGWEVKQHGVSNFDRNNAAAITLMTPEPSDGFYVSAGVIPFIEKYGYADTRHHDRMNFGGVFRAGVRVARTRLTLRVLGYDSERNKITDPTGGIALIADDDEQAAVWRYSDLIDHWKRKHSSAVFVPSMNRAGPPRQYQFSSRVRLGVGTTFERFLAAVACGVIIYDPGIKVEDRTTRPRTKRRSQFRVKSTQLNTLYDSMELLDACEGA